MSIHADSQRGRSGSGSIAAFAVASASLLGVSCGGGGGAGTGQTLPGVVLVDFLQAAQDNVPLNRTLEFRFSSAIDPNSVNPDSIQVRSGALFGAQVFGKFIVQDSTVYFEPKMPGLCDLSDGGFQPNVDYRVTLVGTPEEFAIRNLAGAPLQSTINALFHTRLITDPQLFEDHIPGLAPTVISTVPADGAYPQAPAAISAPVMVQQGNEVVITFSENLNPCTVNENTVLFYQYATGDPVLGFVPNADQTPSTPTTWGSGNSTTPPRRVRSTFTLAQDQLTTRLTLTPVFGEFPDNALLVVHVTNNVEDLGGIAMEPRSVSFVTENRSIQIRQKTFEFTTDFPIQPNVSTGDVNSTRSPGKVQGWLLFAGDGDNGASVVSLTGPTTVNGPVGCNSAGSQANDANPDDFDPTADVTLNTGATRNTCTNSTDGSKAVVFEYRSFRIRNGVTVRLVGVNAAIILVSGDISIEATGKLMVRGDGIGGNVQSNGLVGISANNTNTVAGGIGVAGGGDGGFANNSVSTAIYSQNGTAAIGSVDAYLSPGLGGPDPIRVGQGRGAVGQFLGAAYPPQRISPGGGAGGHAAIGGSGANTTGAANANATLMNTFVDGAGGSTTGDPTGRMRTAEAGSGGGGGGSEVWAQGITLNQTGGSGGAGGGFVDLTSSANITILGTIDASGGRGGQGGQYAAVQQFAYYGGGGGGGGGGSGGGIRILSPKNVTLGATTVLTTAGGVGGQSGYYAAGGITQNPGGNGGVGRIAIEDGDSVISGIAGATLIPAEGSPAGFYRGAFDATRFQGGGLQPFVITNVIDTGPTSPTFIAPDQTYAGTPVPAPGVPRVDFLAGIPLVASRGVGKTGILIEIQGFAALPDGTASSVGSGWRAIGYFKDSGAETFPTWSAGLPPPADVPTPADSAGTGFAAIDGKQFVQFRITFYLKSGVGPSDPGPYLDRWDFYYSYNQ